MFTHNFPSSTNNELTFDMSTQDAIWLLCGSFIILLVLYFCVLFIKGFVVGVYDDELSYSLVNDNHCHDLFCVHTLLHSLLLLTQVVRHEGLLIPCPPSLTYKPRRP